MFILYISSVERTVGPVKTAHFEVWGFSRVTRTTFLKRQVAVYFKCNYSMF